MDVLHFVTFSVTRSPPLPVMFIGWERRERSTRGQEARRVIRDTSFPRRRGRQP